MSGSDFEALRDEMERHMQVYALDTVLLAVSAALQKQADRVAADRGREVVAKWIRAAADAVDSAAGYVEE